MPRLPRIQLEGAVYYVTSRVSGDRVIFKEKADYMTYLEFLAKYKEQYGFKLFSYCLLPDSIHLLIETGEDVTISGIMHDINSAYTKYYNARYESRGSLFESRFRSVLVEKATRLLDMTRFIHRQPGNTMKEYTYSSLKNYTGNSESGIDLSEEVGEVSAFLEGREIGDYERFCLDDADEVEMLAKKLRRGSVLGSPEFGEAVKNRVKEHVAEAEAAEAPAPAAPRRGLVFMVGFAVIVATATSAYLYISRSQLEQKYNALLSQKEAEFAEKTRFENLSPIALTELEGTAWDIELLPMSGDKTQVVRDRIHFKGGRVVSEHFSAMGFKATNISKTAQADGMTVWETIQSSEAGASLAWRGDWKGDAMKGVVSLNTPGEAARDFSFFSVTWAPEEPSAGGAK